MAKALCCIGTMMIVFILCSIDSEAQKDGKLEWFYDFEEQNVKYYHHSSHSQKCDRCSQGKIWGSKYTKTYDLYYKKTLKKYNKRYNRWERVRGGTKWYKAGKGKSGPGRIIWNSTCDNFSCSNSYRTA